MSSLSLWGPTAGLQAWLLEARAVSALPCIGGRTEDRITRSGPVIIMGSRLCGTTDNRPSDTWTTVSRAISALAQRYLKNKLSVGYCPGVKAAEHVPLLPNVNRQLEMKMSRGSFPSHFGKITADCIACSVNNKQHTPYCYCCFRPQGMC